MLNYVGHVFYDFRSCFRLLPRGVNTSIFLTLNVYLHQWIYLLKKLYIQRRSWIHCASLATMSMICANILWQYDLYLKSQKRKPLQMGFSGANLFLKNLKGLMIRYKKFIMYHFKLYCNIKEIHVQVGE